MSYLFPIYHVDVLCHTKVNASGKVYNQRLTFEEWVGRTHKLFVEVNDGVILGSDSSRPCEA